MDAFSSVLEEIETKGASAFRTQQQVIFVCGALPGLERATWGRSGLALAVSGVSF